MIKLIRPNVALTAGRPIKNGKTGNFIAILLLAIVPALRPAHAIDPGVRISQYAHSVWRLQDGAFTASPRVVTQTADGYIWIGTGSGLVRFDGVRFAPWTPPPGKPLVSSDIYSLRSARDGTLWIGTSLGLVSWKNNNLANFVRGRINSILEDREGGIWAARSRPPDTNGGLCHVVGDHADCIGGDSRMVLSYAMPLAEDTKGNLWIGGSNQLMRWSRGSFDPYFRDQLGPFQGLSSVESVAAAADGSVWVAVSRKGLGLLQIVDGVPKKIAPAGVDTTQIATLFVDRDHSLWMGTFNDGVYRVSGERVDHFRSEDGLSSNSVNGFFEDREGGLWVTTSKGLDYFRENRVVTFSVREGMTADRVESVVAARNGEVWIGNENTLDLLREDKVTSIRSPGRRITSLLEDHAGRLWAGVDNTLTLYEHGQFRNINRPDGSPLGLATAIAEDPEQNVWVAVVGKDRRLFRIHDMRVEEEFTADKIPFARVLTADPTGGIWLGLVNGGLAHYRSGKLEVFPVPQVPNESQVLGLIADADGSAWAATRNGLVHWKEGQIHALTSKNGLPCDEIVSAVRDDHSTLWLYAKCGLIAIKDSELKRWWGQPDSVVQTHVLDVFDGAQPALSSFQPSSTKSPDGRLWFANSAVVQMVDPDHQRENGTSPPVYIEQVRADRKDYSLNGNLRLPPRTRDIEIDYTALSFSIPQKVRFRYKLDRRDAEWQDAGARRQVFYSDLRPGHYRFHVTASNNDGLWNEAGTSLDFSVDPAYYQTSWFQTSSAIAFLAILWGLYRYRLHQISREFNVRLEERVGERTRLARDLHDTLLQSFQGLMLRFQVVEELLPPGKAKEELEQTLEHADRAIAEGRSAVYDLRSSATTANDLAEAVRALGTELATPDSAAFRLVVEGATRELHPIIRDELYRITREAARNAFKHARAQHIEVEITYAEQLLRVRIRDDGGGIPPAVLEAGRSGHYGLPGMRERAKQIGAEVSIWSGVKTGTEIELSIAGSIAYGTSPRRPGLRLFRRRAV